MDKRTDEYMGRVLAGDPLSRDDALWLAEHAPFDDLLHAAGTIRTQRIGNVVALCAIANARSGDCSEDCAFCAQSGHYRTGVQTYPLQTSAELVDAARKAQEAGADSFCIVTSGRGPEGEEFEQLLERARAVSAAIDIELHVSVGRLTEERIAQLREAGVTSANHNLETSERFYKEICTTHEWADRVEGVRLLQKEGLKPCSGGIFGMGETWEDRVDLALALRELGVECVPINFLNPREGTPMEGRRVLTAREALRILAVFRFILPDANIRTCGGRELVLGPLQSWMFQAGASATMLGNYLTTSGTNPDSDMAMLDALSLKPRSAVNKAD